MKGTIPKSIIITSILRSFQQGGKPNNALNSPLITCEAIDLWQEMESITEGYRCKIRTVKKQYLDKMAEEKEVEEVKDVIDHALFLKSINKNHMVVILDKIESDGMDSVLELVDEFGIEGGILCQILTSLQHCGIIHTCLVKCGGAGGLDDIMKAIYNNS